MHGNFSRNRDDRADRPMYDAVCAECGASCKVPFKPTGEKPVYCSDCFDKHREDDGGSRMNDRRERAPHNDNRRFERRPEPMMMQPGVSPEQFSELMSKLDSKLDQVIKLLTLISGKKTLRVSQDETVSAVSTEEGE